MRGKQQFLGLLRRAASGTEGRGTVDGTSVGTHDVFFMEISAFREKLLRVVFRILDSGKIS